MEIVLIQGKHPAYRNNKSTPPSSSAESMPLLILFRGANDQPQTHTPFLLPTTSSAISHPLAQPVAVLTDSPRAASVSVSCLNGRRPTHALGSVEGEILEKFRS